MDTELLVRFTQSHAPLILDNYLAAYRTQPDAKTSSQLFKGYEESDRTRGKYLATRALVRRYRKRSAANWLSLAELDTYPLGSRQACLRRALNNQPTAVFSRRFWSSAVRLTVASARRARPAPKEQGA
jgi:hypothetical protein